MLHVAASPMLSLMVQTWCDMNATVMRNDNNKLLLKNLSSIFNLNEKPVSNFACAYNLLLMDICLDCLCIAVW